MTNCNRCDDTKTIYYGNHPAPCTNCLGATYAGIGSRETPKHITAQMTSAAMRLAMGGWVLRSGRGKRPAQPKPDTDSADLAFEAGVNLIDPSRKVIRVATGQEAAMAHAAQYHPAWDRCDDRAKCLHARNSLIMFGDWLDSPVHFVLCWTENGLVKGGTGQAIRIAHRHNIPVFNLAVTPIETLWDWLSAQS